jgi:hypothetical protein
MDLQGQRVKLGERRGEKCITVDEFMVVMRFSQSKIRGKKVNVPTALTDDLLMHWYYKACDFCSNRYGHPLMAIFDKSKSSYIVMFPPEVLKNAFLIPNKDCVILNNRPRLVIKVFEAFESTLDKDVPVVLFNKYGSINAKWSLLAIRDKYLEPLINMFLEKQKSSIKIKAPKTNIQHYDLRIIARIIARIGQIDRINGINW